MLLMIYAAFAPASAKGAEWIFEGEGRDIKVYNAKNGKRELCYDNLDNFCKLRKKINGAVLENRIIDETKNLKTLPEKAHKIAELYSYYDLDITRDGIYGKACARFVSEVLYYLGVLKKEEIGGKNDSARSLMQTLQERGYEKISRTKDLNKGDIVFYTRSNANLVFHCNVYDHADKKDIYAYGEPGILDCVKLEAMGKNRFSRAYRLIKKDAKNNKKKEMATCQKIN